jgi:hypothetical protein
VYLTYDGYGITLTTENGYPDDPRNKIYLEQEVLQNLLMNLEHITEMEKKYGS